MELRQLKTFRTIAYLGSFQEAAKVLFYAQSTISEQIKNLEQELGVKLFNRESKSTTLTEAGQNLLTYVNRILRLEEEALKNINEQNEPSEIISIRMPETLGIYYFPKVLAEFSKTYPKIRFDIINCSHYSITQELNSAIINLAFLITDDPFISNELDEKLLFKTELAFVAHPNNSIHKKKNISLEDLKDKAILLPKEDCSYKLIFDKLSILEKVHPNSLYFFNSIISLKNCITEERGITLIPVVSIKDELQKNTLKKIKLKKKIIANVLMIWRKSEKITPQQKHLMDLFVKHCKR